MKKVNNFYKIGDLYIPICKFSRLNASQNEIFCKETGEKCKEVRFTNCVLYNYKQK